MIQATLVWFKDLSYLLKFISLTSLVSLPLVATLYLNIVEPQTLSEVLIIFIYHLNLLLITILLADRFK